MTSMPDDNSVLLVKRRFDDLDLHDAALLSVSLVRREGERVDDVVLKISRDGAGNELQSTAQFLTFTDCTYWKVDLDLGFKNVAADAISGTACLVDSELRGALLEGPMQYEAAALDDYLEFVVYVCPPAGRVHVFARDFRFES